MIECNDFKMHMINFMLWGFYLIFRNESKYIWSSKYVSFSNSQEY